MAYAQGTVTIPSNTYGFCEGENGGIAIDPEQAQVIRSIYQWFLDGGSLQMIGKRLESQNVLSPRGKETWSIATIRSILSNVKYKGDVLLQKTYKPSLLNKATTNDAVNTAKENGVDTLNKVKVPDTSASSMACLAAV